MSETNMLNMFLEEINAQGLGGMLIFYAIYMVVMLAVAVASYVLQALSCYTIARRREIKKAWLAWIPIVNMWILGSVSDQFQYVSRERVKGKRKSLLVLNIMRWVVLIMFLFSCFTTIFQLVSLGSIADNMIPEEVWVEMANSLVSMLGLALAMVCIFIALAVIRYMALYDLYRSCDPVNAVIYLVLGIFVSITQPIFQFICRNKDLGMPPRKPGADAYTYTSPQPNRRTLER